MCNNATLTQNEFALNGIVPIVLDSVRYTGKSVLTKKIIEPSFGRGTFLIEIVSRIIHEGRAEGKTADEIQRIIDSCVYGFEKDQSLHDEAISRLNELLSAYDIPSPSWSNLICGDVFHMYNGYVGKMDFCVDNPPYDLSIDLANDYPEIIQEFSFVNETTDPYILFYGMGIQMLKADSGRLSYISPNSFLRNLSEKLFRDFLVSNGFLAAIYDFKESKILDDDVCACICVVDKNKDRISKNAIEYREYNMYKMTYNKEINIDYLKSMLQQSEWNLNSKADILYLLQNSRKPIKIKSIATVQNGIATNCDSVYIGQAWLDENCTNPYIGKHSDNKKIVWFNGHKVESTILHRCVKASEYDGSMTNSYILFPYFNNNSKTKLIKKSDSSKVATTYVAYSENDIKSKFPNAYEYLKEHWEELETRGMDPNVSWFAFGHSQGLANSGYKKIVFKHVICKSSNTIDIHVVDDDVIVYSGIYITPDTSAFITTNGSKSIFDDDLYDNALEEIRNILASDDFHKYCVLVGKEMRTDYVSVSSDYIKDYGTMLTCFPGLPVDIPAGDLLIADKDYMNKLFTEKFIDCIKESYKNMGNYGITSTERVKPFHSFLAKVLKYKLGQDYTVVADGYSFGKEEGIEGNFDSKNVDVCVLQNDKRLGAIAFKLLSNNFKQNYKNFSEGLLGETAQMKGIGIPYAFCYLIPEKALYRSNVNKDTGIGVFKQFDVLTQNDVKIYYDIANDAEYKNRTPDAMFIGIHKLFDDNYLNSLNVGDPISPSSPDYLNGVQPEWSKLNFIKDDDIKSFYEKQLNLGEFLDRFIEKMGIDNQ